MSTRYYFSCVFLLFATLSVRAIAQDWQFLLSHRSYSAEITAKAGDTPQHAIELTFSADNDERNRQMYNTTVEFFLPPLIKPYDAYSFDGFRLTISPPTPTVRRDDYIKWEHVEQYDEDLSLGAGIPYRRGWWCTVHAHGVKPGTGKVTAKLSWEDKAGNKYSREYLLKTITVTGEETPPTVTERNQGPKVKFTRWDKSPGKVDFYIDADDRENDTIAGYRWNIDEQGWSDWQNWSDWMDGNIIKIDGLAAGKHTIFAQAKDDKGNEGEIAKKKFKIEEVKIVENQGPSVNISEPSHPFRESLSIVRFELSAEDPEGDEIDGFRWYIDKKPWSGWGDGIVTTDRLTSGTYTIYAQAKDDKGNIGEVEKKEFEIKSQGPIVTIDGPSYPNPSNLSTVKFHLNAEDKEGDMIVGYRWRIDREPWEEKYFLNYLREVRDSIRWPKFDILIENLIPGDHALYVQALDSEGNEGEVARKEFRIGKLGSHIGFNLVRGEIAPWGADLGKVYGIGWGYEVYGEYCFSSQFSLGVSLGFQKYDAKLKDKGYFKIVPLYVRVAYPLFKTSNRRFQLKPFLGAGLNIYRFAGSTDYDDTTAYGVETGLIMEYALNSPTSPNNVSFILQGGINYTHSDFQSTFTSIMLGVKCRL